MKFNLRFSGKILYQALRSNVTFLKTQFSPNPNIWPYQVKYFASKFWPQVQVMNLLRRCPGLEGDNINVAVFMIWTLESELLFLTEFKWRPGLFKGPDMNHQSVQNRPPSLHHLNMRAALCLLLLALVAGVMTKPGTRIKRQSGCSDLAYQRLCSCDAIEDGRLCPRECPRPECVDPFTFCRRFEIARLCSCEGTVRFPGQCPRECPQPDCIFNDDIF